VNSNILIMAKIVNVVVPVLLVKTLNFYGVKLVLLKFGYGENIVKN